MRVVALLIVIAAIAATVGGEWPASPSMTVASPVDVLRGVHHARLGEADGAVPDGTTVFDDDVPSVAKLDPPLLRALRQAATAAAQDHVTFIVDSGWRSPAYQEHLFRQAVAKYGSKEEAARWAAPPTKSAHVSGHAIDLGASAAAWLSAHGTAFGLCRTYENESWHFELRPAAITQGCPAWYLDAAHDPRMR
jgi:zinc D-Ala-D-Ala carboxypeptidase